MRWCEPVDKMAVDRPCVMLSLHKPVDEKVVDYIGAGCEEEHIPVAWSVADDLSETPHDVSLRSRLQVGIVAEQGRAYIGVVHLPGKIWLDAEMKTQQLWRWLGQAAARVVKSQPMPPTPKELARQRAEASAKARNTMTSDVNNNKNINVEAEVKADVKNEVHAPDAGLYQIDAPYLKERENYNKLNNLDFETLVSLVTEKIIEQLRQKGSEAVG